MFGDIMNKFANNKITNEKGRDKAQSEPDYFVGGKSKVGFEKGINRGSAQSGDGKKEGEFGGDGSTETQKKTGDNGGGGTGSAGDHSETLA